MKIKIRLHSRGARLGKIGTAYLQGLEYTKLRFGLLGYNYISGVRVIHSGKYGKPTESMLSDKECSITSLNKSVEFPLDGDFNKLWKLNNHKDKYTKLINIVGDCNTLISAYEILKLKSSSMKIAMGNETINNIEKSWFIHTAIQLKNGSFKFKTARHVVIFKHNKLDTRSMIINNLRDKIVQQALCMVLELIFEPKFLPTSHGFRKFKGCHSALEQIKKNWTGISWFLEFDIHKCFDTIDKHRLISILCERIEDQRFLDLIYKLFNEDILGLKINKSDLSFGVHQNSVISPILCNIYLHKLDVEVKEIQKEFSSSRRKRRVNKKYFNLIKFPKTKEFKSFSAEKWIAIQNSKRTSVCKMGSMLTDWNDPYFIRIRYVRYMSDFLFGIAGSKELVNKIKKRIVQFTKSNLKLELIGGEITHVASGRVSFLGVEISGVLNFKFSRKFDKAAEQKKKANNKLILQQKVKDDRILKAIQLALKKAIRGNRANKSKFPSDFEIKFQAIKKSIILDEDFSKTNIRTYKDFINAIYKTHKFVPAPILKTLKQLEAELEDWMNETFTTESQKLVKSSKALNNKFQLLPFKINAPLDKLRDKLKAKEILSKYNKPKAVSRLMIQADYIIVNWFKSVGQGLLSYYRCCDNFYKIQAYVDYFIRWSAIHTLAAKHRTSCKRIIVKWSKDLIIEDFNGFKLASFPNSYSIRNLSRKFLTDVNGNAGMQILDQIWVKFSCFKFLGIRCAFKECIDGPIKMHYINKWDHTSIITKKGKRVSGLEVIKDAYNYKQIPLCRNHNRLLCEKKVNLNNLDWDHIKVN